MTGYELILSLGLLVFAAYLVAVWVGFQIYSDAKNVLHPEDK